ncbi:unnamed protein product [Prorocentrum cordatum]|uniref:Uncharacterized protein n=1 Tax=Prorocentrum cordatum TaxID=2364126 RepID=A0ABN9SPW1_9DINO|nr:unnamed protein product [Polarella glacialis]
MTSPRAWAHAQMSNAGTVRPCSHVQMSSPSPLGVPAGRGAPRLQGRARARATSVTRPGDRSGACRRLFRCGQGPLLSAVAAAAPAASYFLRAVGVLGIARTCALLLREGHRGASLIV